MPFEKFTNVRSRIDTPKVSIWTRGQIGFNQGASKEYNLDGYKFVVIYYDRETQRIGIELTNDAKCEGAVKIINRKNSGISFSATAFLKHYKIDYSETRKYGLYYDEKNKMFVVDLKKPLKKTL